MSAKGAGRNAVPVAVRLGPEAKAALDVLAERYGGRRLAIETALLAMLDRRELLDRMDRIEARLAGVQVMPAVSHDVDATAAVRAVTAGILALADDE